MEIRDNHDVSLVCKEINLKMCWWFVFQLVEKEDEIASLPLCVKGAIALGNCFLVKKLFAYGVNNFCCIPLRNNNILKWWLL